jgi:hypothetical protein
MVGVGRQEPTDVLDDDQPRAELVNGVGHVCPQPGAGVRGKPQPQTGKRKICARKTPGEHVHGFDGGPVDGGDVAVVGDVGVAVGEDPGGAGVDLGVPGDGAADHGLHALLEAAVQ